LFENEVQFETATAKELYSDIDLNLSMLKLAVATADEEVFTTNLDSANEKLATLDNLVLLPSDYRDYNEKLKNLLATFSSKTSLLSETASLKTTFTANSEKLKELYGDKTKLTRDGLKSAEGTILSLKISAADYNSENIKSLIDATNSMLDSFAASAKSLADCIDVCPKSTIESLADSLASKLKNYQQKAQTLSDSLTSEFEFSKITDLKATEPESKK